MFTNCSHLMGTGWGRGCSPAVHAPAAYALLAERAPHGERRRACGEEGSTQRQVPSQLL